MATPSDPRSIQATNELLGQQATLWSQITANANTLAEALNKVTKASQGAAQSSQQLNSSLASSIQNANTGIRDIGATQEQAAAQGEAATRRAGQNINGMISDTQEGMTALERFNAQLEQDKLAFGNLFDIDPEEKFKMFENASRQFGQNLEGSFAAANRGVTTLISGIGALTSGLFNVGKAIFAIPFQLLGMVAETGNELLESGGGGGGGGGGDNSFQLALEDVREKFGNIAEGEGARVVAMYEKINKSQSNIAGTGRTMADVFGKSAEALKAMAEVYEGLGPLVHVLGQDLEQNSDKLAIYSKGLGLGAEEMQAFGSQAIAAGKPLTDVLEDASRMAISLGKKFGISSKGIAKDLAYMSASVTKFGNIGTKMIGSVSVYMKKLGLEIKDLEGVMGVFDDFESGAQASAKLSSAFGVQIDSMKMMQAENPAEQMQMLRDAFKASGKSLEGLSRQQLKYLGETTGLGDKVLQALSPENKEASLQDAQSAAADAASDTNKQLLKQTEILKILATNIKKIPAEGGGGGGGADAAKKKFTSFIDAFTSGFKKAIFETESYKTMAKNVAESLNVMGETGGEVGKVFLNTFPQIERIFTAIGDLFNPERFKAKSAELVNIFRKFFDGLKNPATAKLAFKDLFDAMQKWFKDLFNNPESKNTITGSVEDLIGYMGNALTGAIDFLIPKLAEIISDIADFISGNKVESVIGEAANTGIGGAFRKAFNMISDKLVELWPKLSEAIGKLLDVVYEKAKPYLLKALALYMGFIFAQGIVLGAAQAIVSTALTTAMTRLSTFMSIKVREMMAQRMATAAATAVSQTPVPPVPPPPVPPPAAAAAAQTTATGGLVASLQAIDPTAVFNATKNLIILGTAFFIALALFIVGLIGIHKLITNVDGGYKSVLSSLAAVALIVGVMAGIVFVAQLLQPAAAGTASAGLFSAAPVAIAAGVLLLAVIALSALSKKLDVSPSELLGYGVAMAAIVAMMALIVLAAYALLGVAPDGGVTAAATLSTIGTIVLAGTAIFLLAALGLMALGVTPEKMSKVEAVIMSAAKIVGAIGFMVLTTLGIGALTLNPLAFGTVATGMFAMAGFLTLAVPALASMLRSLTEIPLGDPAAAMTKVELIKGIFSVLDPMFKMVEKVMDQSDGWATFSTTATSNMERQMTSITNFFDIVLDSLAAFVKTIIEVASGIPTVSEDSMKKAEIFGKMIAPVSELAGSLLGAVGSIKTESAEYNWMGTTTKSAITMESQLQAIKAFILGPKGDGEGGILNSIVGILPTIVTSITEMTALNMDAKQLETLGKKAEVIGVMVSAIGDLTRVFTDISSAAVSLGTETEDMDKSAWGFGYVSKKAGVNMQKIIDFAGPNGPFMGVFGELKKMIPDIVKSFNELPAIKFEGAKDPAERIKSVADVIKTMVDGIQSMTNMFSAETDLTKKNETLSAQSAGIMALSDTATTIMTRLLVNFEKLPALNTAKIEGIAKGMQQVGEIGTYITQIESSIEAVRTFANGNLTELVLQSVNAIREIDTHLSTLDNVNITGRIEKVGKALALRPETLKIDPKPVNININLQFTMDAKDLAKEIRDVTAQMAVTGEITNPFVSQTPVGGGP